MTIDQSRLDAFVGKMLGELAGASIAPLVRIGNALGLYEALRDAGPVSAKALADLTGTQTPCVADWLSAHAAAGYLDHDPATGRFEMTAVQAAAIAHPESPVNQPHDPDAARPRVLDVRCLAATFRGGEGLDAGERCRCLSVGVERPVRAACAEHLLDAWLPSLDGVVAALEAGARVADVGCGDGASTILMARTFPRSHFAGFDEDPGSIQRARTAARQAGVSANTRFAPLAATRVPAGGFDLVTVVGGLHGAGDPVGAAAHLRSTLSGDGVLMVVEPTAAEPPEDIPDTVGRLSEAGFSCVRRVAETPFNMILEARP